MALIARRGPINILNRPHSLDSYFQHEKHPRRVRYVASFLINLARWSCKQMRSSSTGRKHESVETHDLDLAGQRTGHFTITNNQKTPKKSDYLALLTTSVLVASRRPRSARRRHRWRWRKDWVSEWRIPHRKSLPRICYEWESCRCTT